MGVEAPAKSVHSSTSYGASPTVAKSQAPDASGKRSASASYEAKFEGPLQPVRLVHRIVSAFFHDPIESEIDKVDESIAESKGDVDALLDRKKALVGLKKDRDLVEGLTITNPTVACTTKKAVADLERLARTPELSEEAIHTAHKHVVLLQTYARLEKENAWLRQHCNGKTRLAPSGRDVFSLIAREFMSMDSAAGAVFNRFRESDNPADQKVAAVADKALSKQSQWNDWEKRDPSDWKALSREVGELKEIYDSPEWKIFSESLTREKSPEYKQALDDMGVLPALLKDFRNFQPEDVTENQLTEIRSFLMDRVRAREDAVREEMYPYLYTPGELFGGSGEIPVYEGFDPKRMGTRKMLDKLYAMDDSKLSPKLLELRKDLNHLKNLETKLESIDLKDKKAAFKTMEKVAGFLDESKADHLKLVLRDLVYDLEKIPVKDENLTENNASGDSSAAIQREITQLFLNKDLDEKGIAEGASKIILMTSRASYIRLALCRVQELEKKLKEISTADTIVSSGMNSSFGAYGSFGATRKIDEGMKADELKMKTLLDDYRGVLSSLRSEGDQAAAIEKFSALEKSKLHKMIDEHFEGAEIVNTFTKGFVVTVAAIATGGYAASLVPEAFAGTTLGGFVTLGVETAAFTVSSKIYRSLLDLESPLKPLKEMWDKPGELVENIVTNMIVFGALRKGTSLFGEAFSALVKREGTQTALKKIGDFLAKIEKDPALQAELSATIQKTFVNIGSQGGALVTQTGVLQVSDFLQTAKALAASGDDDPIGHALEKTFASQTLVKEFAFNLALHFAPMPSHGAKGKTVEAPSVSAEIEKTLAACGAEVTEKGRITYDPAKAKKSGLFDRFHNLQAVSEAKDLGITFNFLGPVVEVSIPTPLGVKTYTLQPQPNQPAN